MMRLLPKPACLACCQSALFMLAIVAANVPTFGQSGGIDGEWTSYAADSGSTKFTKLSQINGDNFTRLEMIWHWVSIDSELDLGDADNAPGFGRMQATPLMVDGVLYMMTALNQVAALEAVSGELLWSFDPQAYLSGNSISPLGYHHRGVAFWSDASAGRIVFATNDGYLFSIDVATGEPDTDFAGGRIDLTEGIPRADRDAPDYNGAVPLGTVSPVVIVGNIVIVNQITSNRPRSRQRPPTWIRGFDIRSGELIWTFHSIPQAGEFGVETWEEKSWHYTGNGGVWTQMSADPELGLVYLPTEAPTNDFYGGHRPGDNLFTQSVVALNASSGERVWHFQMIHHGIWDYDTPAAPNLMDISVDGRQIKALAQVTKQGWVYVFDRVTGNPVWPMPEQPVPVATMPGERASPTQPFPSKPPPFARQGLSEDDLIDFTPDLKVAALKLIEGYVTGPLFTPATLPDETAGKLGTVFLPGVGGGANWHGAGFDPQTNVLYVPSLNAPTLPYMVELPQDGSNMRYIRQQNRGLPGPQGLPILKPPYATITAFDMDRGEILWQVPNGEGMASVENNSALEGVELPPLGGGGRYPILVTATLLVHGQNAGYGPMLIARDKASGQELARIDLPANPIGAPMSYAVDGKQYIALSVATSPAPKLVVFALP
ncbi:MAG: PQQ-binding-like beta-propeller repeat protein [Gammaproteobacteria bacterium]|nr:PQQ-binding-like beta-propeller repeat protein [Gammaproteobacteria bacterium]